MNNLTAIDTSTAKLPATYAAAKRAISQCASIDECKDWSDKAAALASYAKQAKDSQLEQMARRIRARATRRAGELLRQVGSHGGKRNEQVDGAVHLTRSRAALDAGLSERQAKTAQRLANVPDEVFEEMVESNATITAIAEIGTEKREPDRAAATALVSAIKSYAERLSGIDLDAAAESLNDIQKVEVRMLVSRLDTIHDRLVTSM